MSPAPPGSSLRVEVLTAEPGDLIYERFGHNMLRIVDEETGLDLSWNWGVFSFDQEGFVARLIRGTMLYQVAPYRTEVGLDEYARGGRAVWAQVLDLTPEERYRIQAAALENYEPENRFYRYDYYRDNCSTRIRDILDRALGGRIGEVTGSALTPTTYRWHTRRLLRDVLWAYTGIELVLGNRADRPITEWQEMFLPMKLHDRLARMTVVRDEVEMPLVREERLLLPSERAPVPDAPPGRMLGFLAVGVAWALAILLLARAAAGGSWIPRAATAVVAGGWGLSAGLAGTVLALAWAFTDHVFWSWNENLLQTNPLSLAAGVGLAMLLFRRGLPGWVAGAAGVVAGLSVLGLLVQLLPGFDQVNGEVIALSLPANLAVAVAARALAVPSGTRGGEKGPTGAGGGRRGPAAA